MPTKKKTSKQTMNISWRSVLVICLAVVVGVGVIVQVYFDRYLVRELNANRPHIRTLLADAITSLNRPAAVDGPTGKVYLTEAKLVLPPYTPTVTDLLYVYTPPADDVKEELTVTTRSVTARTVGAIKSAPGMKESFEALPEAQACSRQFRLTFAKDDSWTDYEESFTKHLQDGRTLYVYTAKACKVGSESLEKYLRDIESYTR